MKAAEEIRMWVLAICVSAVAILALVAAAAAIVPVLFPLKME